MGTLAKSVGHRAWRLKEPQSAAYRWLLVFMVVYCARPEDWIPGLRVIPLAKITGFFAVVAFLLTAGQSRRRIRDWPRETFYLLLLFVQLSLSAILSTVWRGGAVLHVLDFSKAVIISLLITLTASNVSRLRSIVFVQTASVAAVAMATIIVGHSDADRLQGVLNGMYSNPNDLAFYLALSLPFCCVFMLRTRSGLRKAAWAAMAVAMVVAVSLTASRSGLLALAVSAAGCLWEFGVRGRRPQLLIHGALLAVLVLALTGKSVYKRFVGTFNAEQDYSSAYGSTEQRRLLLRRSLEVTFQHPVFGVGTGDFQIVSGVWRVTHNTYTQLSAEAGIPALILFLLLFRRAFVNLRNVRRLAPAQPETLLLTSGLRASLAGFMVGAMFESVAYLYLPYILLAFTSALVGVVEAGDAVPAPANSSALPKKPPDRSLMVAARNSAP